MAGGLRLRVGPAGIKGGGSAHTDTQQAVRGWERSKGEHTQRGEMTRGLLEEVMSEQRCEWMEGEPRGDPGKDILGRGESRCKGPGVVLGSVC